MAKSDDLSDLLTPSLESFHTSHHFSLSPSNSLLDLNSLFASLGPMLYPLPLGRKYKYTIERPQGATGRLKVLSP